MLSVRGIEFLSRKKGLSRARLILGVEAPDLSPRVKPSVGASLSGRFGAHRAFTYAGLNRRQVAALCARAALGISAIAAAAAVSAQWWLLSLILLVFGIEHAVLRRRSFERAERFEKDYTALLLSLASAVRTGLDPLQALCDSNELFAEGCEIRKELEALKSAVQQGRAEEAALRKFGQTIRHPDIELFRTGFILARREGSSLSECLQRLCRVTRQRQSFRRKISGAVAMQRLSSYGIVVCAGLIGLIQAVTNLQAFRETLADPLGIKALSVGTALIVIGLVWMLRLTRSEI